MLSTTLFIFIFAFFLLALNGFFIWRFVAARRRAAERETGAAREAEEGDRRGFLFMQNQIAELTRTLDSKLSETARQMQESSRHMHDSLRTQFTESQKIVRDVTEGLVKLDETNRQVVSFASQLQSLQDILQNPKRRGVLGEYYLETVLKNVLPPAVYAMQYRLGKSDDGADLIVDAAIFVQEKIIPVDSKFSLENYNRLAAERDPAERERLERLFKQDLKARIDETAKYIRPEDGTLDFALMFIPSEGIFYDLIINTVGAVKVNTEELIQYAARKRVNIVSPNSFYAFLQVILHGLRQVEIEKNTEQIRKRVGELGKHLKSYEEFYNKLGNALSTTVSHYSRGYREFQKIDKDVFRISGESIGVEPTAVALPERELAAEEA